MIYSKENLKSSIKNIIKLFDGYLLGTDIKDITILFILYKSMSCRFLGEIKKEIENYSTLSDEIIKKRFRLIYKRSFNIKNKSVLNISNKFYKKKKGFEYYILPSQSFDCMKNDTFFNLKIEKTLESCFKNIIKYSDDKKTFKNIFNKYWKIIPKIEIGNKNKVLYSFINEIGNIDIDIKNMDTLGDIYEIFIDIYNKGERAINGEFFTPYCISNLMASLCLSYVSNPKKIYDPTCGSGSLLIKFLDSINNVKFYGQERNTENYNLCKTNFIMCGLDNKNIYLGDTLTHPKGLKNAPFDIIVSNPPFSTKWDGKNSNQMKNDPRFNCTELAPLTKADLAFTMHSIRALHPAGVASIVHFPGVLYRGGTERAIRGYLVVQNYIDSIILLPQNIFSTTNISVCIVIIKKNKKDKKVLFVDAVNEFITKDKKSILTQENINNITSIIKNRKDVENVASIVDINTIEQNDFNLSPTTYINKIDKREKIDIVKLNAEIRERRRRCNQLADEIDYMIKCKF